MRRLSASRASMLKMLTATCADAKALLSLFSFNQYRGRQNDYSYQKDVLTSVVRRKHSSLCNQLTGIILSPGQVFKIICFHDRLSLTRAFVHASNGATLSAGKLALVADFLLANHGS